MHASAFLKNPQKTELRPVVVLYGSERYLKLEALERLAQLVLGDESEDLLTKHSGKDAELKTICDELLTISMWGDSRLVLVEDADEFVSKNRNGLEKYCQSPSQKSVLVLDVKSWPKNTKLAKIVAKSGLDLDCGELKPGEIARWVVERADATHSKKISRPATQLLIELTGNHLGQLDQELSKLSVYVGERDQIETDDVRKLVGGLKTETTWTMVNSLRDGDLGTALQCLDKLLIAGEAPQKILGGLNYVYRKLAKTTDLSAHGTPLNAALKQAGVFPRDIPPASGYLRRIGRGRAEQFYSWLATTDNQLKGTSRVEPRILLEQLLVRFSGRI